jgi:hypothetical protein
VVRLKEQVHRHFQAPKVPIRYTVFFARHIEGKWLENTRAGKVTLKSNGDEALSDESP